MCSAAGRNETGGVLMGRYNGELNVATVTRVVGPPPDSRRGRSTFVRGTRGLQQLIERLWRVDEYYLGEWHFHPGGTARPSSVDIRQMKRISESGAYNCPEPILIVVGGMPLAELEVVAHVFPRNRESIRLGQLFYEPGTSSEYNQSEKRVPR